MTQAFDRKSSASFEVAIGGPPPDGEAEVDRRRPTYIRWVQRSLNRILSLRLAEDGRIGPQTRSAIRSFQQMRRLNPDGMVGLRTEAALIEAGAGRPPGNGADPGPSTTAPVLIRRETEPPGLSLYVNIALGGEAPAPPMTGIFLPQRYRPLTPIDFILYLHGFKARRPSLAIDGYWNRAQSAFWPLREGVNDSGKNVVLVAPTLGPRSQTGWLTQAGGLDRFLDQVLRALAFHGPFAGAPPRLGRLILACHSGGGWPMRQLALSDQRGAAAIRECWGFDCTYNRGDDTQWARWASARPAARLYIYYISNSPTQPLAAKLKALARPNIAVLPAATRIHDRVPITHWRERLDGAAFLARS